MPARKKAAERKNAGKRSVGVRLREQVTESLELPREVVLDVPKILMSGDNYLIVENYKGIIEYEQNVIRLNTKSGMIKIEGHDLFLKEMTSEEVIINGTIDQIQFLR